MFIVWILLLLLPLFSEMEFFGIKLKKEIEKATRDISHSLKLMQEQIYSLQNTNSINMNSYYGTSLPNKLEIAEQMYKEDAQIAPNNKQMSNEGSTSTDFQGIEKENVFLFKVRLELQTKLKSISTKLGYIGVSSLIQMARYLVKCNALSNEDYLIIQDIALITNRAVHGEIISSEYYEFVKMKYPVVIKIISEINDKLTFTVCPFCRYAGPSVYENECPVCGHVYCYD